MSGAEARTFDPAVSEGGLVVNTSGRPLPPRAALGTGSVEVALCDELMGSLLCL